MGGQASLGGCRSSIMMSFPLLPLAFLGSVSAHGGVLWPPIWQAGEATPIEELTTDEAFSDPVVRDPNSGRVVKNVKSWLTDQAYTGGVGDEFKGIGPVTNDNNKNLERFDRCGKNCVKYRNPWTSPIPWRGLWCLWRNPLGMPCWQGRQAQGIGMWSRQADWSRHERNIILWH